MDAAIEASSSSSSWRRRRRLLLSPDGLVARACAGALRASERRAARDLARAAAPAVEALDAMERRGAGGADLLWNIKQFGSR